MSRQKQILLRLAVFFCVVAWSYRLFKLFQSIQTGVLYDFVGYYGDAQRLWQFFLNPGSTFQRTYTFAPPLALIPFLPLALLPLKLAEFVLTLVNLACFALVFFRLIKERSWVFWLLLGFMAFSFPLIYSLGMGNPVGVVTLGIYAFWIVKNRWVRWLSYFLASVLKLFPLILVPLFIFSSKHSRETWRKGKGRVTVAALLFLILLVIIIFPAQIWITYGQFLGGLVHDLSTTTNPIIYNQSISASLARLGVTAPTFSIAYWSFVVFLSLPLLVLWKRINKEKKLQTLDLAIVLLSFILLVHPLAWQYYFAIFLPYLVMKIINGEKFYILVLVLMSVDGNRFLSSPLLGVLLGSSQFIGTLLLYGFSLFRLGKREQFT